MIEQLHLNVHKARFSIKSGWEQWVYIGSDHHFDSTKCDRDLLTKHFKEAKEKDALIILNGDWYDLMQSTGDRRAMKSALRKEYLADNYLDRVIQDSVDFLEPYKDNPFMMGQGNHEMSMLKFMGTNVVERTVEKLKAMGSKLVLGQYTGWLLFSFSRKHGERSTIKLHYHHGYGGNAKRSKGVLGVDLDSQQFPDADIIVRGHDHNKWHVPVTRDRISLQGAQYQDVQHHVRLGSYKKLERLGDWATMKGFNTPTLGGWWIRFYLINKKIHAQIIAAD